VWIFFGAWGLLFLPKFQLLLQTDEQLIEQSRSEITQEKSNGFSFASIAAMTQGQIRAYYSALKIQLNKAERTLDLPLTNWIVRVVSVGGNTVDGTTTTPQQGRATSTGRGGETNGDRETKEDEEGGSAASTMSLRTPVRDRESEMEREVLSGTKLNNRKNNTLPQTQQQQQQPRLIFSPSIHSSRPPVIQSFMPIPPHGIEHVRSASATLPGPHSPRNNAVSSSSSDVGANINGSTRHKRILSRGACVSFLESMPEEVPDNALPGQAVDATALCSSSSTDRAVCMEIDVESGFVRPQLLVSCSSSSASASASASTSTASRTAALTTDPTVTTNSGVPTVSVSLSTADAALGLQGI